MDIRKITACVSPSLLASLDTSTSSKIPTQFSIGMSGWMESDPESDKENDCQPPRKKNGHGRLRRTVLESLSLMPSKPK